MQEAMLLKTNLLNATLSSPVLVGSGPLTDSLNRIRKFSHLGAGAVVAKTIYSGKSTGVLEKIHVSETGLFNSTTYSTKSLTNWLHTLEELNRQKLKVILSIHAENPKLLGELAYSINKVGCMALELGIACPNDGSQQEINPKLISEYVAEVKKVTAIPIIVKLAAVGNYIEQTYAAIEAGMDALSLSDTIPSVVFDSRTRQYVFDGPVGYSGPAIKPIVLHAIYQIRKLGIKCPIIGIGGIQSAEDVLEYIHVGANAVQVYTALMLKPKELLLEINQKLIEWCLQNNTRMSEIMIQS